jgi:hypothetical protein
MIRRRPVTSEIDALQHTPRPRWDPSPDILSEGAGSVEQYPVIPPVNIFGPMGNAARSVPNKDDLAHQRGRRDSGESPVIIFFVISRWLRQMVCWHDTDGRIDDPLSPWGYSMGCSRCGKLIYRVRHG